MASIPITLLTGFLGSGKTTFLNRLLKDARFARSLVVINEFGQVSLDHVLVTHGRDEGEARASEWGLVELTNGCVCCSIRHSLEETLVNAAWRFSRGGVRSFDRVIVETTGLADPWAIVHLIHQSEALRKLYRLEGVVTMIDGRDFEATLLRFPNLEPLILAQVRAADLLIISKLDDSADESVGLLRRRLNRLNPLATVMSPKFDDALFERFSKPARASFAALRSVVDRSAEMRQQAHQSNPLGSSVPHSKPIDAAETQAWIRAEGLNREQANALAQVLQDHPERLIRAKAIYRMTDSVGQSAVTPSSISSSQDSPTAEPAVGEPNANWRVLHWAGGRAEPESILVPAQAPTYGAAVVVIVDPVGPTAEQAAGHDDGAPTASESHPLGVQLLRLGFVPA